MEAKIPLTELGISTLKTADELKVNLAVTSSKSATEVNSVIYSPYNWFGTTEAYFEPIILSGTPVLNTKIISAYTVKPSVDGIRDSSYLKVLDYTPANAGLVYGQGGDFTTGDLTGSNNVKVNAQGLSAKAYFTWDSNNLYYFSECTDNSIQAVASIGLAHLSTDNRLFIKNGATIKNINFVNTINGLVAISGGQAVSKITSKIKLAGKSYTIEARIPWSAIGIASPKTGSQLMINMAQTSSKSTKVVNSVIYSPYNWFGTTDVYFEKAVLEGYPAVTDPLEDIKNPVKASAGTIKIDGFREDFYNSIFDFSPSDAGLVYGQGGDFKVGDLTGTNNSKVAAQKLTAKGYFTWDKGFLYFISECTDNSIIKVSNINQHYLATDNRLYIKNKNEVKEIRFIITEEGVLVINSIESGVAAIDGITAAYKTDGTKYSIEAKIPWSTIGIAPPETGSQLLINLVITSSKSLDSVNSVIYSKYNWFGVADSYFETINFVGNPQNPKTSDTQTSTLIVMILLSISIIIVWGRKNRKRVRIQS
jgi:LPXTG-motif cell wall-anchored protein